MKKLSDAQTKLIEEYWKEIDDYREKLKFREWQLLDRPSNDTNIGGGKSNRISDPTSQRAILLAEDKVYQNYKNIISAIDSVYAQLDEQSETIVNVRYWGDNDDIYEWNDLAVSLNISRNAALRKRNQLIDKTAEKLGWL